MKIIKLILPIAIGLIALVACTDEKQESAKVSVKNFENYVDSTTREIKYETEADWEQLQSNYEKMKNDAKNSINDATNKEALESDMDRISNKWNDFKTEIMKEKEKIDTENPTFRLSKLLFGEAYINDDMQFTWVNKNNILSIYENLINTVEKNKDNYTIEDWDKIKLMYDALNTRKNTVENEGLSTEDNLKIATLKLRFGPLYTINRITAKSEENQDAKQ